jgi:hypothetical protein
MYAPDGRTYKEWLGESATTAIQVHTLNDKKKVTSLEIFSQCLEIYDLGLYAGNVRNLFKGDYLLRLSRGGSLRYWLST